MANDMFFTKTHEWVRIEGESATIGVTAFAQEQLGDITYVELPREGDTLVAGQEMCSIESVKAASEIYSPISGEVVSVNVYLDSAPGTINTDPYGGGWLVLARITEVPSGLLTPEEYDALPKEDH